MTVSSASLPKISVEALAQRIFAFRQMTPLDRQLLQLAVLDGLNQKDHFHRKTRRKPLALDTGRKSVAVSTAFNIFLYWLFCRDT